MTEAAVEPSTVQVSAEELAALRSSEARFRSIVETTSEWVWELDPNGRITYANPTVERILGYTPPELLYRSAFDLVHDEDRDAEQAHLARDELTNRRRGWTKKVARWRCKDGRYRLLESTARPIFDEGGRLTGFHGTSRDVTDERAATDLQQTTLRQLEAYALDIRTTFSAEKQRAEELALALDELERTYLATVRGMAVAVEAKDEYTGGHISRVTTYGLMMMRLVAPEEAADPQYEYGFLLHDIGKLAIPDAILTKDGPLTDAEWVVMRSHVEIGGRILASIPFLESAREIVLAHHERWDGGGYPRGLSHDEIPLGARVFPLADAFDAMRSDRPYRKALPLDVALEEIRKGAGTQFWPDAVDAFLSLPHDELDRVAASASDPRPDDAAR